MNPPDHNPALDLSFERHVELPPEKLWAAWTTPELLMPWFCPRPWETIACEIDLRPGGIFSTVMRSPEGQEFPGVGCYLELVTSRRLVWTNALAPGFRPVPAKEVEGFFFFTGIVTFMPQGSGTLYGARVVHGTAEDCQKHAALGFEQGWSKALDQLVEFMQDR